MRAMRREKRPLSKGIKGGDKNNNNQVLLKTKVVLGLFKSLTSFESMVIHTDLRHMQKDPDCPESDKVDYYLKVLQKKCLFPDVKNLEERKDDKKSEALRMEGNLLLAATPPKYMEALKAYNKSLCFAVSKENQSLTLINRSGVFFKMEMYQECLDGIQLARDIGLLDSVRDKVARREAKCLKNLKKIRQKDSFVLKIGLPANEKIPFLAKCLELRENKQYGRFVVTDKDIPAGTIISIKEPFCKIIPNEDKYMRCTNCFAQLTHLLMPCDTCTQAMFCSKECKEKAHEDFHVIECPISGTLYKMFDIHSLLAFRMTIKAFLSFPDTPTLSVALEKIDVEQKNVFSYDWSEELSEEDLYATIRTLKAKAPKKGNHDLYVGACLAYNLLKNNCPTLRQRYLTTNKADKLLKNLLCQHFHAVTLNSFNYGNTEELREGHNVGTAICDFYSLINHSCTSNVAAFVIGGSYGIVATKNISKGKQLFTNYGVHHTTGDKENRQDELLRRYGFHCQCQACSKDFPTMDYLPMPRNIPEIPFCAMNAATRHELYSVDYAKKGFRLISEYIQKNGIFFPSFQLCKAQKELMFCLQVLCGVPLQIREKILVN